MHSDGNEHDTPVRPPRRSTRLTIQRGLRVTGWLELTTFPASSTATHKDRDGHDTAVRPCPGSTSCGAVQTNARAGGENHPQPTTTATTSSSDHTNADFAVRRPKA